jgi:acyl-coenzyme A synthetase/AMP-(fatty) acid ligase
LPDLSFPDAPVVHLKTTSATTGSARLIAFTAGQIAADARNIVETMRLRPDWPNLGVISLAHSYGFSSLVTPLLLHGIPLILAESALPEAVRRAVLQTSALTLPAVPALWRAWHEAGIITPNIRLAISAGAPLPGLLERSVHSASGVKIHTFYGASECGGIAFDAGDQPREDDACVGAPIKNVQLDINPCGCLRVHSEAVGEGYWPEPDHTLSRGTFQTSDLAELSGGNVLLRGRAGELINFSGRKVAPQTIERALLQHPLVRECVVVRANPSEPGRGDDIAAIVVSTSPLDQQTLRQFLLPRVPAWQIPRRWHFLTSLPVSPRGKLSRAALAHTFFGA